MLSSPTLIVQFWINTLVDPISIASVLGELPGEFQVTPSIVTFTLPPFNRMLKTGELMSVTPWTNMFEELLWKLMIFGRSDSSSVGDCHQLVEPVPALPSKVPDPV